MKKSLEAVLRQFHEILEAQQRVIESSNINRADFLAALDRYQNEQTFAKCTDAKGYRRILARSDLSETEQEVMMARFLASRNRPPETPCAAIVQYAANLERARMLQRKAGLSPEKFADAYGEKRACEWRELNGPRFSKLTFEQAKSDEEHAAIFWRHGVFWWWKLKAITENKQLLLIFKSHYEQSAFKYELQARINTEGRKRNFELGKPWWFLDRSQRERLAQRWPTSEPRTMRLWLISKTPPTEWRKLSNIPLPDNFYVNPSVSVDRLANSLNPFVKTFLKQFGIRPLPNWGHPLSWRWLELFDKKAFGKDASKSKLTASERGSLSDARKWAKSAGLTGGRG